MIVVTGASGFIGGALVRRLRAEARAVRANGRDGSALAPLHALGADTLRADLAGDSLQPLFEGAHTLVHCAALSSPWGRRDDFIRANVTATRRTLEAAARAGVKRVVHLSSPSLYFRLRDQYDLDERFVPPRRWITAYAESKWLAEQEVRRICAAHAMEAAILRPRAVFGPGDRAIFPRLIAVASRGRFPLVGGGRARIDVTHIDNLVDAMVLAMERPLPRPVRAFNISNGEPMAVAELLELLFGALGLRVRYLPLPRPAALALATACETIARLRPGQPEPRLTRYTLGVLAYSQTLDIGAAREVLGYTPALGVRDGILRFACEWSSPHDQD